MTAAGGLRIAKQSGYLEADLHEVVIGLVQANTEIRCTAETVRVTDQDVSLLFVEIEPVLGIRCLQCIVAHGAIPSSLREGFRVPFSPIEEPGAHAFAERNRYSVDTSSHDTPRFGSARRRSGNGAARPSRPRRR